MGHSHDHPAAHHVVTRKLAISMVVTVVFVIAEVSLGLYANSLALIGDAFHNLTDVLALGMALWAVWLERRPATPFKSYGYQRAGVIAAFLNAGMLVGFTVYLLIEAWQRFLQPQPIESGAMLATAIVAIIVNTLITFWLHEHGKNDINVRSAVMHQIGDALSAVGILIGAIIIRFTGLVVVDVIITVLIAALILWSSWGILRETVNLLLEGTPRGIDPEAVTRDLAIQDGVFGVHHLHIWALGPSRPALSCHLMLGDVSLRSAGEIQHRATMMLKEKYGISHTTIQVEYAGCPIDDPFCNQDEQELAHM